MMVRDLTLASPKFARAVHLHRRQQSLFRMPLHVVQRQTRLRVNALGTLQVAFRDMSGCGRGGKRCGVDLTLLHASVRRLIKKTTKKNLAEGTRSYKYQKRTCGAKLSIVEASLCCCIRVCL